MFAMTPGSSWALLLTLISVVAAVVATGYRRDVVRSLDLRDPALDPAELFALFRDVDDE